MGSRARRDQVAQRLNSALEMLNAGRSTREVIALLSNEYGISARQARRYLEQAQEHGRFVEIPESKQVFTVKLSNSLVQRLRETAREQKCTLSSLVEEALEVHLDARQAGRRGGKPTR